MRINSDLTCPHNSSEPYWPFKKTSYTLVSACLMGLNCRYDNTPVLHHNILGKLGDQSLLMVCPEILGGLPTPRPPVQFVSEQLKPLIDNAGQEVLKGRARLVWTTGQNVTQHFIRGAQRIIRLIKPLSIHRAYLKSRSPSCGSGSISFWDARTNSSVTLRGDGVLTTLLKTVNIRVIPV